MFKLIPLESGLNDVTGFFCGATNVGMRTNPVNSGVSDVDGDVAFIRSEAPCDISSVFTSNTFQAAPIKHYQKYPKDFQTNFLLINAKNANAMTGDKGIEDIDSIMSTLSVKQNVLNPVMSSTGVIGYRLPVDKITSAFGTLDFNASNTHEPPRASMTTDSFKKEFAYTVELEDGHSLNIAA
ncbi:MAG: bifunctional ornithine acetyltransferase/N-acetylglutamate synthase, partial [Sulfurovum sp.]|nr:bifunctional ornithine acetyltransferase/N-acetylglutamate synthase [Sulfurovum sp.]NNJ44988.1 bifunctional ornithine acetyltransferase/N-acetylglutamate synthase [Sulfurovum sp.]